MNSAFDEKMITKSKLDIYHRFGGDIDGFARSGSDENITDDEWWWIDQMISRIRNIEAKLTSQEFEERTNKEMEDRTDSKETQIWLRRIANED